MSSSSNTPNTWVSSTCTKKFSWQILGQIRTKNRGKLIEAAQEETINWCHSFSKEENTKPDCLQHLTKRQWSTKKDVRRKDKISKQLLKQRADSKQYVKKSETKVGDKVLCRQQGLKKHTPEYNNEILKVIKRQGSLAAAKGETRTITRQVTFCKRLPHDLDANTPTPTLEQAIHGRSYDFPSNAADASVS